ncbi:MAG: hypothetical protein PUG85_07665 [Oscillospiraceae bacterium]|nr:hypothetical protein [Oscillospiraceae bacterium]
MRMKIYCPLLQTTVLFAVPLKAAAKPSALRGQYERRLLVAEPPPAIHLPVLQNRRFCNRA